MSPLAHYVIQTLVTVAGITALAVLVLYGAGRIGIGRPTGSLELVGRLPLEGRRAIYLVRVAETVYVLGSSEAGINKLGELSPSEVVGTAPARSTPGFSQVLERALGRRRRPGAESGGSSE
ncbi:MAG TPA: flagellar biosynthetic protein FliO [Polyangiaceae bacterium]|jgi:flagellar biogenesis protein FliO